MNRMNRVISRLLVVVLVILAIGVVGAAAQEVSAGSYVTFGTYPQTAEGNDNTPIEWLVLHVEGDRAFLLSRYGLDAKPYNVEHTEITWEECTLRAWLNGEFLSRAFSEKEQAAILLTDVDNSRDQSFHNDYIKANSGNDTQDKVFLLSYAEARDYLGLVRLQPDARIECAPTAYADEQGAGSQESIQRSMENRRVSGGSARPAAANTTPPMSAVRMPLTMGMMWTTSRWASARRCGLISPPASSDGGKG